MTNLIEQAVAPLRDAAVERAEKEARAKVAEVEKDIREAGWDLQKCAPYPRTRLSTNDFRAKVAKYKLYQALVHHLEASRRMGDPEMVEMAPERIEKFVEVCKRDAGFQYDAFVAKLCKKIGDVTDAKLEGNHVWGYSTLHVTKPDGTREHWKTQMIVNVSKLGTLFNQWPTRKVKA